MTRRKKAKPGLDNRAYRKARNRLRQISQVCWLCGKHIDITLPYTDAMSWTADHIIPRSKGGHLLGEMKAAHRACNSSRGNRTTETVEQIPTSRLWLVPVSEDPKQPTRIRQR